MDFFSNYTLVFFDFDGLLVDTESLHFLAYQRMCQGRGYSLDWDFPKYCQVAHSSAEGLRKTIYQDVKGLFEQEPNWAVLYEEKKAAYRKILAEETIQLMPGVDEVLTLLQERKTRFCVVTNSFKEQVMAIRDRVPLLQSISEWVTREDYKDPKPSKDPYVEARRRLERAGDRMVGFEDTKKGLMALQGAGIEGVIISSNPVEGASCFSSFLELLS